MNDTRFDEKQRLPDVDVLNVHDLCYLNTNFTDLAILSFANTKQVKGVSLTSGDVIWTQDAVLTGVPLDPCLCCSPSGPIFLGNGNNILVLNPLDGSHSETLLADADLKGISTIIFSNYGGHSKFAVKHEDSENSITYYDVKQVPTADTDIKLP